MYTTTVIAHAYDAQPAMLDINVDVGRSGIERIFQQLLSDRGRALDDLPRRNLIRQPVLQGMDSR